MGEGEWAGEATRGFCVCAGFRFPWTTGEAWAGAGEPASDPNLMPEGGPPAVATGGVCLIWTDDLRSWALPLGPPLTMAGMTGIAGLRAPLPFTGDTDELLPCWALWGPPTATGGGALDTIVGLVALAYELRAVG
jgi:hypothetical protein